VGGAVLVSVELFGRDGGEGGGVGLSVNHRIHAYRVGRKRCGRKKNRLKNHLFSAKNVLTAQTVRGYNGVSQGDTPYPPQGGVGG